MLSWALILTAAAVQSAGATTEAFRFDYVRMKDRIEADGHARRTVEVSVLMRTPAAVQQFGQLALPYVDGFAEVSFEDVRVQKPSGATREVTDGQLEDLNPFGINDAAIPVDIRIKKLTIPRLEPGDRLSYRTVTALRPFVPGEASGEMKFTPVSVDGPQVYELDIPATSRLTVKVRPDLGSSWEVQPGEKDRLVRRLTVTVPPTVIASTGLTEAQADLLQTPDVSYSTFASWSRVSEWWWEMSRPRVQGDEATKREAGRIVAGKTTSREKIEALAAFVSSSVRYLNVSFGIGRMQLRQAASVLSSRYGDCKDKVGLLIALADAVGVEVRPVLIHSVRRDLQDDSPGPHQFDHVIAAAILGPSEKDWLWMDVTNSLSPSTTLWPAARDKRALMIDRRGLGTVVRTPATPPMPSRTAATLTGKLEASGLLKGHVRFENRNDSEPNLRSAFASVSAEQHGELLKSVFARTWREARISSVKVADPADLSTPFWVEFEFERDVTGIESEKEWKLWVPDLGPVLLEASADTTARKPVQFDVGEVGFTASVDLPENVGARAPLSIAIERPFASLTSTYSVAGRTLRVDRVFRFPAPSIPRDQVSAYEAVRKAASTDREQEFVIGPLKAAAGTAASLQKEGKAARTKKEFARAVELLEKAAAADPKLEGVQVDLGLALRDAGQHAEAIAAFSKAIETSPFHESAYADRAYSLFELDRNDEAEKDLHKQIEVAPFEAWSYGRLAGLRSDQGRHADAAELYSKALTIDPKDADNWVDLAWEYIDLGKPAEAKEALDKSVPLGLRTGQRVGVGLAYRRTGDIKTAGELASKDLGEIRKRTMTTTVESMSVDDLYWHRRLAQTWQLIGEAALEASDLGKADRYLTAAWEGGFLPEAAHALGVLREREGNHARAASLWAAAVTLGNWDVPKDLASRREALGKKGFGDDGAQEMARIRFVKAPGPVAETFSDNVLVLVSGDQIEGVKNVSLKHEKEAAPILGRFVGLKAGIPTPDGEPGKLLRRGILSCDPKSGCMVVLNIVAAPPRGEEVGAITILQMSPADGSTLRAGQVVRLRVSASYAFEGADIGEVTLVVSSRPEVSLVTPQPTRTVRPGKGVVDFDVTFTAPKNEPVVRVFLPLSRQNGPTRTVASAQFSIKP